MEKPVTKPPCKNCGRPYADHRVELQSSGGEYVSGVVYICPTAIYVPIQDKK